MAGSLTATVYQRIRADLLACRLAPGVRLHIAELATRVEASPGAVREALSRLTAEGLVTAEPQRGFQAAAVSLADLADLTQVRIEIETLCVRSAIARATETWAAQLHAAHRELLREPARGPADIERASDEWSVRHAAFHETLVSPCGSQYLLDIRRALYARGERYRRLSVRLARATRDVRTEHAELVDAAVTRDIVRSVALVRAHLAATARVLEDALFPVAVEHATSRSR